MGTLVPFIRDVSFSIKEGISLFSTVPRSKNKKQNAKKQRSTHRHPHSYGDFGHHRGHCHGTVEGIKVLCDPPKGLCVHGSAFPAINNIFVAGKVDLGSSPAGEPGGT